MKNQSPSSTRNRLGSNQIIDIQNQMQLQLPDGYRIYNNLPGIWIGGTEDSTVYIHLERIPAKALVVPPRLAQGDLDIQVQPKGTGYELINGIFGQEVSCRFRSETLSGLWLKIPFDEQHHYLFIIASKFAKQYHELEENAVNIALDIKHQMKEPIKKVA